MKTINKLFSEAVVNGVMLKKGIEDVEKYGSRNIEHVEDLKVKLKKVTDLIENPYNFLDWKNEQDKIEEIENVLNSLDIVHFLGNYEYARSILINKDMKPFIFEFDDSRIPNITDFKGKENVYNLNLDDYDDYIEIKDYYEFYIYNGSLAELCDSYDKSFDINRLRCYNNRTSDIFIDEERYDYLEHCEECGDWFDRDDAVYVEDWGCCLCPDCIERLGYHYCECRDRWVQRGDGCTWYDCPRMCEWGRELEEQYEEESDMDDIFEIVDKRQCYSSSESNKSDAQYAVISTKNGIEYESFNNTAARCGCGILGAMFGVEVETVYSEKKAELNTAEALESLNRMVIDYNYQAEKGLAQFIVKEDSSLSDSDNDFEFVPVNLCGLNDIPAIKALYKKFFENLEITGFYNNKNCGAHIHLDLNSYNNNEKQDDEEVNKRVLECVKAAILIQNSSDSKVEALFGRGFGSCHERHNINVFHSFVDDLNREGINNAFKIGKRWLNTSSHQYFYKLGEFTFEFRIPDGVDSFADLIDRVASLRALLEYVENKDINELMNQTLNQEILMIKYTIIDEINEILKGIE